MVAAANTALDLGVLEDGLLLLLHLLLLRSGAEPDHRSEVDVLGDAGGISLRAGGLALLDTELGPVFPLGHARVHDLLDDGLLDAAGGLDLLAVLVDLVGDDRLGAILVLRDGGLREGEGIFIFFFGPVAGTPGANVSQLSVKSSRDERFEWRLTLRFSTFWRWSRGSRNVVSVVVERIDFKSSVSECKSVLGISSIDIVVTVTVGGRPSELFRCWSARCRGANLASESLAAGAQGVELLRIPPRNRVESDHQALPHQPPFPASPLNLSGELPASAGPYTH